MNITTYYYFAFVLVALIAYYVVPIRFRWVTILAANLFFIWSANSIFSICVWGITGFVTFLGARLTGHFKRISKIGAAKFFCAFSVVCIIGAMLILKDGNFFVDNLNKILPRFGIPAIARLSLSSPLGISYYSLVWAGYVLDVYWGSFAAERNVLKFFAFCGYFPVLTSGPIARFEELESQIVAGQKFTYKNLAFGSQRILWGLMKKLVVSERLAVVVNTVYDSPYAYPGAYIWIAYICFALQLYTDFSGCIDIVIGTSEMFGITLPENFDLPFMSLTVEEFWRRWHITLGGWLKDYIFYPILKSAPLQKLGDSLKEKNKDKSKAVKKFVKKIPTWIGLLPTWILIGFWHGGGWNYIIGVGLFFGVIIILSDMLTPAFDRLKGVLRINTDTVSYRVFQRVRTFMLFVIGLSMFRSTGSVSRGITMMKYAITVQNPWVLIYNPLEKLGLSQLDIYILLFYLGVIALGGIVRVYKKDSIREIVSRQNIIFRWLMYFALFFSVLIFGSYGTDFDSSSFIYMNF